MGNHKSKNDDSYTTISRDSLCQPGAVRVLMLGLMGAGKSTLLYKHASNSNDVWFMPFPTSVGFEHVKYANIDFISWDVDIRNKWRWPLWRQLGYYKTDVLIWMIDSTDIERMDGDSSNNYNKEQLHRILAENDLKEVVVLILANKQDLPNAMSVEEIGEQMEMYQETSISKEFLLEIKNDTLLVNIPEDIIAIISKYTPTKIIGPAVVHTLAPNINDWQLMEEGTIPRRLFPKRTELGFECYQEHPVTLKICNIILSYVSKYDYKYGTQTNCNIMGCSVKTGEGINEAIEWISQQTGMNAKSMTPKKDCVLL